MKEVTTLAGKGLAVAPPVSATAAITSEPAAATTGSGASAADTR